MEMREEEQTAVTQHVTALGTEMDSGRYAQHLGEKCTIPHTGQWCSDIHQAMAESV